MLALVRGLLAVFLLLSPRVGLAKKARIHDGAGRGRSEVKKSSRSGSPAPRRQPPSRGDEPHKSLHRKSSRRGEVGQRLESRQNSAFGRRPATRKGLRIPRLVMRARSVDELKYLNRDVPERAVEGIRAVVEELHARAPNDLIVFRGRTRKGRELRSRSARDTSLEEAAIEYDSAIATAEKGALGFCERVDQERYPSAYDSARRKYLDTVNGEEILAVNNQASLDGRHFISTTRDLSVAFGDYYKASDVRYVYILQVPRDRAINVHGLVRHKSKLMRIPEPPEQREKEIAIALDATPYVRAVYDIETGTITTYR